MPRLPIPPHSGELVDEAKSVLKQVFSKSHKALLTEAEHAAAGASVSHTSEVLHEAGALGKTAKRTLTPEQLPIPQKITDSVPSVVGPVGVAERAEVGVLRNRAPMTNEETKRPTSTVSDKNPPSNKLMSNAHQKSLPSEDVPRKPPAQKAGKWEQLVMAKRDNPGQHQFPPL